MAKVNGIKFDEIKKKKYLEHLERGLGRMQAIASVAVSRDTLAEHRKRDPEFARSESEAEMRAVGTIENALFDSAKGGNVTAQQVYLYNRAQDRWKDQRNVNHTGRIGMTIEEAEKEIGESANLLKRFKLLKTGTDGNGSRKGNGSSSD